LPLEERHHGMSCGEVMEIHAIFNQALFAMVAAQLEADPDLKELLNMYMWYNFYQVWNRTHAPCRA
jgi:hypothetical protein